MSPPPPTATLAAMNAARHLFSREEALMNTSPDHRHRPRSYRLRRTRTAAIITALGGAGLLVAACGGSPSSAGGSHHGGGSASSASGIAYSQCMRAHGVPNFPDLGSGRQIPKAVIVAALRQVSDSVARRASDACASLYPRQQTSQPLTAQQQQDYLRAAACIRSHGFPGFPDPTFSGGSVHFNVPPGMNTTSPQAVQAVQACRHFIPAGLPYSGSGG